MTRERAAELWPIIKAYGEGKKVEYRRNDEHKWLLVLDDDYPTFTPGQYREDEGEGEYRIKPEPKKRPMTRGEVLYMVTTTPGMVVRPMTNEHYITAPAEIMFQFGYQNLDYEYAIIDASGEPVDGWHKFEKEVTE